MNKYPTAHLLFVLVIVAIAEMATYSHNPRKAFKRAISGLLVFVALAVSSSISSAATPKGCLREEVIFCALGSIGQLIPYTIACIVLIIVLSQLLMTKASVVRLHPSIGISLSFILPLALLFGNTALCYWFAK
jgi:hypothetical protein